MKRQKGLFSIREWGTVLTSTFPSVQIEEAAAQCQWQFCSCHAPVHPRSQRRKLCGTSRMRGLDGEEEKSVHYRTLGDIWRLKLSELLQWQRESPRPSVINLSSFAYLKLRKNKWGNGEDFDLCCRRRTQNLRDPVFHFFQIFAYIAQSGLFIK